MPKWMSEPAGVVAGATVAIGVVRTGNGAAVVGTTGSNVVGLGIMVGVVTPLLNENEVVLGTEPTEGVVVVLPVPPGTVVLEVVVC